MLTVQKFGAQAIIELEEIPDDLVVNWNNTGIHYVLGQWKGSVPRESRSK